MAEGVEDEKKEQRERNHLEVYNNQRAGASFHHRQTKNYFKNNFPPLNETLDEILGHLAWSDSLDQELIVDGVDDLKTFNGTIAQAIFCFLSFYTSPEPGLLYGGQKHNV